jgi:hypothetical protein
MEELLNHQPTKNLQQFQKLIVQDLYIKKLNLWLDELSWENEKKDAIIEMKDSEITKLERINADHSVKILKVQSEFKQYINKVKAAKIELEKQGKQQEIISELRQKLASAEKRLQVSSRMNQLLARQNGKK